MVVCSVGSCMLESTGAKKKKWLWITQRASVAILSADLGPNLYFAHGYCCIIYTVEKVGVIITTVLPKINRFYWKMSENSHGCERGMNDSLSLSQRSLPAKIL